MKTKEEHKNCRSPERGNALVYVLIAIALFAALTMTMGRQTDTSEATTISDDKVELYAGQLISYAAQVKSALDQMDFSGVQINDLDFTLPNEAGFETEPPPNIYKVYHPSGGGIIPATLPKEAQGINQSPYFGWWLGRYENVGWTATGNDVVLTAYNISRKICETINLKITGTTTIPVLANEAQLLFVDPGVHGGSQVALSSTSCPDCNEAPSLCVTGLNGNSFNFYSIVAQQ